MLFFVWCVFKNGESNPERYEIGDEYKRRKGNEVGAVRGEA